MIKELICTQSWISWWDKYDTAWHFRVLVNQWAWWRMSWQWVAIMCGISSASQVNRVAPWINSSTDVVWPNVYVTLAYKLTLNLMNKECRLLVLSAVTVGVLRCCCVYSTLCIWTVSQEWINYNEIYNFKESHGVIGRGVLLGISRVWINQPHSPTISYNLCTKKNNYF